MNRIKVLLADDHTVVRQELRSLLVVEPDIEVVGEAENGRMAVQMTRSLAPDVVIMDIGMPQLNGLEAARQIVKEGMPCKVLVLVPVRQAWQKMRRTRPDARSTGSRHAKLKRTPSMSTAEVDERLAA